MVASATLILLPTDVITNTAPGSFPFGPLYANTGSLIDAVTPGGPPVTHDDDTTYALSGSPYFSSEFGCGIDDTFAEKIASVVDLKVWAKHRIANDESYAKVKLAMTLNATLVASASTFTIVQAWNKISASITRPGGGDWTEADLRHSTFEMMWTVPFNPGIIDQPRLTSIWVEVEYIPLNRVIDLEREVASRRLRLNREPEEVIKIYNGWEALEGELMDAVAFSHAQGPTHDAKGWGLKDWERGFGRLKAQSISLAMPRVESTIGNRRRYQTTFWEIFKAEIAGDADIADGMPRLDAAGADREFTRSSAAWVEAVGGVIQRIAAAKEKIEPNGELLEEARTNLMTQSSFVNGTTGWTKADTTGVTAFATDTGNLLFGTAVSAQSVKLTVSTAPYDSDISRTSDSLGSSTVYSLSVDWEQDKTATTEVAIQNTTTSNWLQSDGGSWGAARVNIALGTEVGSKQRDTIGFTTESTASTHKLYVNVTGSTNGAVHNIFHVQIEAGAWASSRIVTEASAVTRAADFLTFVNDSSLAQRIFSAIDKFTFKLKFRAQWAPGDLSDDAVLFELSHDASNWIRIYVAGAVSNDPLRFEYRHAGTTETAFIDSPSITADTEHEIVIRRTSTSGELDLTNRTCDVFLDGTKGTADTASGDISEASTSDLTFGSRADGTKIANVHIVEAMVSPWALSDVEIAGGLS